MSTITQESLAPGNVGAFQWMHRTCSVTGLKLHRSAELLIKANAVAATVALLIGGISAILILLTRWQAVHLLEPVMFYRVLTAHGLTMLIFFIISSSCKSACYWMHYSLTIINDQLCFRRRAH